MDLTKKLFMGDRVVWIIFLFLCLISLTEVFSASSTLAYKNPYYWGPIVRHASLLLVGCVSVVALCNIPSKYLSLLIALLPLAILFLALTPLIGEEVNDAHRWVDFMGIKFQPSELAKISGVTFVAFMLSRKGKFTEKQIYWSIVIVMLITCLLILTENFSTAFILAMVVFLMMIIGQISFIHLVKTAGTVILFILLVFMALKFIPQKTAQEYLPDRFVTWQTRIDRFNDKGDDYNKDGTVKITDDNYQVVHAKIALANGGLFGKLPGRGQQRDFLPQAYSDFIYAIIIEELGFVVGGIGVLFLYIMLLFRVGIIARKCGNKLFPKYLVIGCGLIVVLQALTNMAVAVDLIPVTGQPMPLVSRGGTSTIISCLYFGIILSVSRFAANIGNEAEEDDKDLNVGEPVVETSSVAPVTNATSEKTPSDVSALVERAQDIPKDSFVEIDQNKESETESKI